jgi:hypothetical protein
LNEIVVEGSASVWLTWALVEPVDHFEIAESGIMFAGAVLIALPAAAPPDAAAVPLVEPGMLAAGVDEVVVEVARPAVAAGLLDGT